MLCQFLWLTVLTCLLIRTVKKAQSDGMVWESIHLSCSIRGRLGIAKSFCTTEDMGVFA